MTKRRKVLIVDDEEPIVMGLLRVLYRDNDRYDVLPARTAEIAQQILRETDVDLMVTDIRMPGMSGLDLLLWASVEAPTLRVLVMTSHDTPALRASARTAGVLQLVQKPFDLHKMRDMIVETLETSTGFGGSLGQLATTDVVQMLCLARKTTALRVARGRHSGFICIEEGEIYHAVWDDREGEDALYRILTTTEGVFQTVPNPIGTQRTIEGGWQGLLMEAMCRSDEGRLDDPIESRPPEAVDDDEISPSSLARSPRGSGSPPKREVAQLIDEAFEALRAGDSEHARRTWKEALEIDPENRMIELNLRRLEKKSADAMK